MKVILIGLGEGGLDDLSQSAKSALRRADAIVGGQRHLAMLGDDRRPRMGWPKPFSVPKKWMQAYDCAAVLATGDPFNFGVGRALSQHFSSDELEVYPAPSAFSLLAARLNWALQDCSCISMHGRPLSNLSYALRPGAKILALGVGDTGQKIADLALKAGFDRAKITAFSHMGSVEESCVQATLSDWSTITLPSLTAYALDCGPGPQHLLSLAAGLPDDAFVHDGQLTKQQVRALTIAQLAPANSQTFWDVGAGCGSIGIEWLRLAPKSLAIALEADEGRLQLIEKNALALGAASLDIRQGTAPDALTDLPAPDCVFVGGGVRTTGLLEACWQALKPKGRLVANAVTLEAETRLLALAPDWNASLSKISIAQAQALGSQTTWRSALPITQMVAIKPAS